MQYWLMKSEPSTFSIEDLAKKPKQTAIWDGVRNYQVRNMLRDQFQPGDLAFFYHSSCAIPGIVGVMEIVSQGYPDPSAFDPESRYYDPKSKQSKPTWYAVDVKLVKIFPQIIALQQLRHQPKLKDMRLLQTGNRLSITPITTTQWQYIHSTYIKRQQSIE